MYNDVTQGPFRFSYDGSGIVVYDSSLRIYSYFREYKPRNESHFRDICYFLYLKKMKKIL